ncbi:MAG: DinB family protein [Sphingobacteriaceae bacterium]|nr:DinB family protein [Sphingobacteriaceae bacterium]
MKTMIEEFLSELEQEAVTTRKMLGRVPEDKYDWKPHEKSMSIKTLSGHIAELPSWVTLALTTSELDFAASPYRPPVINGTADLLKLFENSLKSALSGLRAAKEEDLLPQWTLREGEKVLAVMTNGGLIRHSISQIIHHRAQLGVYLRLLNVPVPASYGPSADEMS